MALFANTPDPETMMRRLKSQFVRHLVLHLFDGFRKELDHPTAFCADHMIVVLVIVMMLVVGLVVAKPHFTGQPGIDKEFQSPIDRCMADRFIFLLHQPIKILTRQVVFGPKEGLHYQVALRRPAQA